MGISPNCRFFLNAWISKLNKHTNRSTEEKNQRLILYLRWKLFMKQACATIIHSALVSQKMAMLVFGCWPSITNPSPKALAFLKTSSYDSQLYSPSTTWKNYKLFKYRNYTHRHIQICSVIMYPVSCALLLLAFYSFPYLFFFIKT